MTKRDNPPEVELFLIHCEAQAAEVGPIIATLTRMGVRNIGYELRTVIPVFAGNGRARCVARGTEERPRPAGTGGANNEQLSCSELTGFLV
jgi:hypothetical protein